MGRVRSKKNKLMGLLEKEFNLNVYTPSLETGDEQFYLTLNDVVRIRYRLYGNVLVIDDVCPLTTTSLLNLYERFAKCLMTQTKYTVLVSILGNTQVEFQGICFSMGAIVVEDERFNTCPKNFYYWMKEQHPDDPSVYGFYLLTVNDQGLEKEPDEPTFTQVGVIPLLDQIKANFMGPNFSELSVNDERTEGSYNFHDIIFTIKLDRTEAHIFVSDISKVTNYTYLATMCFKIQQCLTITPDIYMEDVWSLPVCQICEAMKFESVKYPMDGKRRLNVLGRFKVK